MSAVESPVDTSHYQVFALGGFYQARLQHCVCVRFLRELLCKSLIIMIRLDDDNDDET